MARKIDTNYWMMDWKSKKIPQHQTSEQEGKLLEEKEW